MPAISTITRSVLLSMFYLFAGLVAPAQAPHTTLPDAAGRLQALSTLWMEAKYNFAYFDNVPHLNWDSAYVAYIPKVQAATTLYDYYRALATFLNLLQDGHTDVSFPSSLAETVSKPGIRMMHLQDQVYIFDVDRVLADSVPVGSVISHVNAEPIRNYITREVLPLAVASVPAWRMRDAVMYQLLRLPKNSRIQLTLILPNSKSRVVSMRCNRDGVRWVSGDKPQPLARVKMLPGGIVHLAINTYDDKSVVDSVDKYMPMIRQAKGLVLDIRENGGGNSGIGAEVLFRLTDQKLILGSRWSTRMHIASYRAWGMFAYERKDTSAWGRRVIPHYTHNAWYDPKAMGLAEDGNQMKFDNTYTGPRYTGPLVVLQSWKTGSAAEDFLIMLHQLQAKRATTLGEPTIGSTGQPLSILLPGGIWSRICTKRDTWADGRKFVGIGIAPDMAVQTTAADYFAGKDVVLEKALKVLAQQMKE